MKSVNDDHGQCQNNPHPDNTVASETGYYHVGRPEWLKTTSAGVQHMPFPAMFINPVGTSGDPTFDYSGYVATLCSGRFDRDKTLSIGVTSFACFTRLQLEHFLNARDRMATDGVDYIDYKGAKDTTLTFTFRYGADCALEAIVRQR